MNNWEERLMKIEVISEEVYSIAYQFFFHSTSILADPDLIRFDYKGSEY